jgi:hypothetical protein
MLLYVGIGLLVASQVVGLYGLVTRKADLVFAVVMLALLAGAIATGGLDLYHRYR